MKDTLQHVTDMVKGEVKRLALGEPVGVTVTQTFAPVQTEQGIQMLYSWVIAVDMNSGLVGMDPICFPVLIPCQPGYMPGDKAFKDSCKMALDGARNLYAEVRSIAGQQATSDKPVIDGNSLIVGKR